MAHRQLSEGLRLLYHPKKAPFNEQTVPGRLPEAYRRFWREWKCKQRAPVHYIPVEGKWRRDASGQVVPVQNIPLPLRFPRESHSQLWGGEGVVQGFQKRTSTKRRVPHFWVPQVLRSAVYSEILDCHMTVVMTTRAMDLIMDSHGFDHYILKTPACDLQSELAVKIKRRLLQCLSKQDLYLQDEERWCQVYNKYKHYLDQYTEEDIEWYGLTLLEACKKLLAREEEESRPVPLKNKYRLELVQRLLDTNLRALRLEDTGAPEPSWLSQINPFGGKQEKEET